MVALPDPRHWQSVAAIAVGVVLGILLITFGCRPRVRDPLEGIPPDIDFGEPLSAIASGPKGLFEDLKLQEVHSMYQGAYLDLIQRIYRTEGDVEVGEVKRLYANYELARRKYGDVLRKVAEHARNTRLTCFANMKSVILAIVYADRKTGQKTTRYDPERLKAMGAFPVEPKCPDGGMYSLYTKDNRRFINCTMHGTLKTR